MKHLIHQDTEKLTYDQIKTDLDQLALRAGGSIEIVDMQPAAAVRFDDVAPVDKLIRPQFSTRINRRWGMNSYTGLLRGRDADLPDHDEMSEPAEETVAEPGNVVSQEEQLIASLAAGARTGQLLHDIYEHMDFTDSTEHRQLIEKSMQLHGHLSSKPEDKASDKETDPATVIETILANSLAAVLDEKSGLTLQQIENKDRLNEMEFFFSVANLDPGSLQTALASYPQYTGAAHGLNFSAFEGLMQGFIDMVVRKDNRYFIVDYKSNRLGESLQDYSQTALAGSISSHRYNLQYLIYTVALHRYLGRRVADYNYDSHFGGVYYLFIRGMRPGTSDGVWFDKPPFALIDALDQMMQTPQAVA